MPFAFPSCLRALCRPLRSLLIAAVAVPLVPPAAVHAQLPTLGDGSEMSAAAERRHVLVEVERVGAAQEEGAARIAAEDVGDADRRGDDELRQRAVGGDDAGRRRLLLRRDAAPVVVRET